MQTASASGVKDPLAALMAHFQMWSNASRAGGARGADPLVSAALAGMQPGAGGTGSFGHGVHALDQQGQVADPRLASAQQLGRVNSVAGSAREGQAFQQFDLGNGLTAHVYYDGNGRRQVIKIPTSHGHAPVVPPAG